MAQELVQELVQALIENVVSGSMTCGHHWPNTAEYAVVYSTKCWPCDWKANAVKFFDSLADLLAWREEMSDWATLEDNYYEASYYQWDWGPRHFVPPPRY